MRGEEKESFTLMIAITRKHEFIFPNDHLSIVWARLVNEISEIWRTIRLFNGQVMVQMW